jgi:hypothetical protein
LILKYKIHLYTNNNNKKYYLFNRRLHKPIQHNWTNVEKFYQLIVQVSPISLAMDSHKNSAIISKNARQWRLTQILSNWRRQTIPENRTPCTIVNKKSSWAQNIHQGLGFNYTTFRCIWLKISQIMFQEHLKCRYLRSFNKRLTICWLCPLS